MQFITTSVVHLSQGETGTTFMDFLDFCNLAVIDHDCALSPTGNIFSEIESAFASGVGWLITFCFENGGNKTSCSQTSCFHIESHSKYNRDVMVCVFVANSSV